MPQEKVALMTDDQVTSKYFDFVIPLPHGDLVPESEWKLINDIQVYEASPFDQTIKLEADMYVPVNIDYWFDLMSLNHVSVCKTIRNFKNEVSDSDYYRKLIIDNNLPNVYNAITYFDKSEFSKKFFNIVNDVFINWENYKNILKCNNDEPCTTDWAYALACHIMGEEKTTVPSDTISMVHMKQFINNTVTEDWTNELVYELSDESFRIQTHPQLYPVHYHIKHFANTLKKDLK